MLQNGVLGTDKKRSENAQPQNEILCSKGAWGRCPQQADGRKCECVLTLALLAGFVCGYPHALLANVQNNRNRLCAAAENHLKFKYWKETSMRKILSCEFNLDTACVELCMEDGILLSIDCTAVENEVANGMYQRSELDWLIYNDPLAYAELILNEESVGYLKRVTTNTVFDN